MSRRTHALRSARSGLVAPVLTLLAWVAVAEVPAQAQTVVRVPGDVATLQQALDQQRNRGGVIELAAGTYVAPNRGFRLRNPRQGLTVRAAAGATVVLEGEGAHPIFELENSARENGQRVFFENLVFRNGFSAEERVGGAVSVIAAEASFLRCRFEESRSEAPTTGGGAVLIFEDSDVVFLSSEFHENSAQNRGGAVAVVDSTVEFHDSVFRENRTNFPGHADNAAGGGIFVLDSKVRVVGSRFEDNETGWVGGAIFVFGTWQEPVENPAAELQVFDSAFVGNRAANDACCTPPGPTAGGAIHVEDHATVRIHRSEMIGNSAETGGAVDSYRAVLEVFDSAFRGNFTAPRNVADTFGGAFFLVSSDFNDPTTDFGAINRRPASLRLEGSLVQGAFEGTAVPAQNGACLAAVGDINRRFGDGPVPQDGSIADNRAQVVIRDSAFFDCDVEGLNQGGSGFGGALSLRLADLTMEDSLVLDSDCLTDNCGGGGLAAFGESRVGLERGAFAGNSAHRGGAVFLSGSTVEASETRFVANRISAPGGTTDIRESRGAGIFAIPGFSAVNPERNTDVDGFVESCEFADNEGLPIFDVDVDDGPHNTVRYDDNRFGPTGFGNKVYVNLLVRASGESAAELNALVVRRGDGTSTDKSQGGNLSLGSSPVEGTLLAVPPALVRTGPEAPGRRASLAFVWSGPNATLDGQNLPGRSGLREVTAAGDFELRSGGTLLDEVTLALAGCSTGPLLCLNQERFKLGVDWETPQDQFGPGRAVQLTGDTGYFFFFNESNVEMVVKVLDACGNNGHYWAFAGGLTNVETEMRVTDSLTGVVRIYENPQRTPFQPLQDTAAFPTCDVEALASLQQAIDSLPEGMTGPLLLNDERFEVGVRFRTPRGQTGEGQPVKLTSDTGYYFFFNESNVEMVIKVLRGCGINGNYWVFAGGLTNVEVEITVTDTQTGAVKTYLNPLGTPFQPIQDTDAFATCP